MFDPWKSAGANGSKVILFSHTSELHVFKGVIIMHALFLACDCQDLTFRGVKLDVIFCLLIHIWKGGLHNFRVVNALDSTKDLWIVSVKRSIYFTICVR